ncbi:MAG: penicillin-binding protein 2 [Candidatus Doudnabacteria bacterium]|nr:penicillin-binding protein 2 [Candidatus Doudnabacteria bacterium]
MNLRKTDEDSFQGRIFFLAVAVLLSIGLIVVRLFFVQVISHDYYSALAQSQQELSSELIPERGEVYIRDKFSQEPYPLVRNVNRPLVFAVPQQISDAPALAKKLSAILGLDSKEVLSKITNQEKKYVPLAKQVEEDRAEELKKLKLPGIYFEDQIRQDYPEGTLAAQVLGFVAFDEHRRVGRYGLEYFFEKDLAGKPGFISGAKDPTGVWITGGEREVQPAEDGVDLILTLDRAIQFKAEEVLEKSVVAHGAKSGSVVVLDPKTGAILAMANYPSFDPNHFNEVPDPGLYNNTSVQAAYEPGSVLKPITFAGSLDAGAITPDMTFDDPGSVTLERFTIRNAENKTYGAGVSMTRVLEESINTGAIFAEQQMGHDKFLEYLEKFGFGKFTEVTLPFEAPGDISNLDRGGDLYPATAAFGQGITVTQLQLAQAYAAIANGGRLFQPFVIAEKVRKISQAEKTAPRMLREVVSAHTASTLSAMLVSVVEKGHGKRAAVPGYFIAGKTGTAQIAAEGRLGYDVSRSVGTFAGFGPIDDPRFVMVVKIDEPQGVRFAESTAAPAFGEIAQFILNYYQVPKSR